MQVKFYSERLLRQINLKLFCCSSKWELHASQTSANTLYYISDLILIPSTPLLQSTSNSLVVAYAGIPHAASSAPPLRHVKLRCCLRDPTAHGCLHPAPLLPATALSSAHAREVPSRAADKAQLDAAENTCPTYFYLDAAKRNARGAARRR